MKRFYSPTNLYVRDSPSPLLTIYWFSFVEAGGAQEVSSLHSTLVIFPQIYAFEKNAEAHVGL